MTGATPLRPVPAVLALVPRGGEVLLVRRANPPDAGLWGFPGGRIELGETVHGAAERELREETGVEARALRTIAALDVVEGPPRAVRRHFVLIGVLCRWQGGEPVAADDALDAAWFDAAALGASDLPLSRDVAQLAALALAESARAQVP